MVAAIKHYMNPLHVYCRLRDMGISRNAASFVCRLYERAIFKHFARGEKEPSNG
jgi:hypothetical protein